MKFRYREPHEMKDSGVEWLGMIPKEWEIRKLKTFFTFEKGKNAALYTNEYIGNNEGEYPVYSGQTENNGIMGKINSYDYDTEECIFTTTVGAKVMTPMLLKNKFSLSQNCLIMIGNHKINNRYTYNLLFPMFRYEKSIIPTHMQPSLRIDDLNKFKISYPKLNEQEKIATFLDQKTAEFDNIIAKKQAFIDKLTEAKKSLISEVVTGKKKITLPPNLPLSQGEEQKTGWKIENRKAEDMKDSGVEWLGMIPKEWGVTAAKRKSKIFVPERSKPTLNNKNDGVPWITIEDIKSKTTSLSINNLYVSFDSIKETGSRIIQPYSILVSCVGTFGIASINTQECIINQQIQAYIPKGLNVYFMRYIIVISEPYFNSVSSSTTLKYVNAEKFKELPILLLKSQEQQLIVDFLDEKTAKIDNTIEKIKVQIEKLKEAKQSLISEAVTGKIEVM